MHEMIQRIWRNRNKWLRSMVQINPVVKAGTVKEAVTQSIEASRQELFGTRVKIMIYEAQPEKYDSLDDIKIN